MLPSRILYRNSCCIYLPHLFSSSICDGPLAFLSFKTLTVLKSPGQWFCQQRMNFKDVTLVILMPSVIWEPLTQTVLSGKAVRSSPATQMQWILLFSRRYKDTAGFTFCLSVSLTLAQYLAPCRHLMKIGLGSSIHQGFRPACTGDWPGQWLSLSRSCFSSVNPVAEVEGRLLS